MAKLNNIEALTSALKLIMTEDKTVVCYGEDVGVEGGVFRATKGLQEEFGEARVWDSPISEAAITGAAIGAALAGLKPILEIQFSGFSFPAFMNLFTQAARFRSRTRGQRHVPMVLRMPVGGMVRALEHHSEAIEALYAHIPGLKVVMPSNPYDTKGLLIAAVEDEDPVVFLEHKRIYRAFKQEVPEGKYTVEIGKAAIISEGDALTIVTYGAQVHDTVEAIKSLGDEAPSIELIDLRTISPFDKETIWESVKKTGRLLIVTEEARSFSVAAEIAASVQEHIFEYLLAPVMRVTGHDVTVPLAKSEHIHSPVAGKIAVDIREIMEYIL